MVRDELLEMNPSLSELLPKPKDLNSLHDLDKSLSTSKKFPKSIGSGDNRSKEN